MKYRRYMHLVRQLGSRVLILLFIIALTTNLAGQTVLANTPDVTKEEVIYIKLKTDGSVDEIYVVNAFNLIEDGQIVDYGNYTTVRNLSTSDEIKVKDNQITINAAAGRFEYQGTLNSIMIPWDVTIRYYLDGAELQAESLAGQSGALKVVISVAQHHDYAGDFFDSYALQVSLALDAEICKNIASEDATIANSGDNKQLSFIVLPEKGAELSFTANVTDFTMDGVTMAGVKMNLDFELDESEFAGETQDLKDAVSDLDDGVGELKDGTEELVDGVSDLKDGTGELVEGVTELDDGVSELYDNMDEFVDGAEYLSEGVEELTYGVYSLRESAEDIASNTWDLGDGANEIADGLYSLAEQNPDLKLLSQMLFDEMLAQDNGGITISEWLAGTGYPVDSDTTIEELEAYMIKAAGQGDDAAYQTLSVLAYYKGMIAYMDGVDLLQGGASQIAAGVYALADGTDDFADGLDDLYDGVFEMKYGTAEFYEGTKELRDGIGDLEDGTGELLDCVIELEDGVLDLYDGVVELHNGIIELKDGTAEFRQEIEDIDSTFADNIEDKLNEMLGKDSVPVSFVDERNINIDAVQFVMTTADIELPETEEETYVNTESLSFWDRFIALFKGQ